MSNTWHKCREKKPQGVQDCQQDKKKVQKYISRQKEKIPMGWVLFLT